MVDNAELADAFAAAKAETDRLERELDITNADHIALWLEANVIPHDALRLCQGWLAVQIVEAHERALRQPPSDAMREENERLRTALCIIAGSTSDTAIIGKAQAALGHGGFTSVAPAKETPHA